MAGQFIASLLLLPMVAVAAESPRDTCGCGANPTGNPIGGGKGYGMISTSMGSEVRSADELCAALKQAQARQRVFVPDDVEIDLSGRHDIGLPGGVTNHDGLPCRDLGLGPRVRRPPSGGGIRGSSPAWPCPRTADPSPARLRTRRS